MQQSPAAEESARCAPPVADGRGRARPASRSTRPGRAAGARRGRTAGSRAGARGSRAGSRPRSSRAACGSPAGGSARPTPATRRIPAGPRRRPAAAVAGWRDRRRDRRLGGRALRERDRPVGAAGPGPLGRQRDNAVLGELLEQARGQAHAAGTRAGLPVQVLADGQGEFGAAQPGASLHHFLHVGDLPSCEALAEERRGREVLNARVNRWARCQPNTASQNAASMSTPWEKKFRHGCNSL